MPSPRLNAVPNLAVSAVTRRSQASAMPSPAPKQLPLIAAMTGFGMVTKAVTMGA